MPDTLLPYVLWDIEGANNAGGPYPVIPAETTPYPEGSFCVPITMDAELATKMLSSLFTGAMISYPEEYLAILIPFLEGLNNLGECGAVACDDAIINIRRNNGWLEVLRCGEETYEPLFRIGGVATAGSGNSVNFDWDGNGTTDQYIYQNSYNNTYGEGLPIADDNDRMCRAAWALAATFCGNLEAVGKTLEAADKFFAGAMQSMLDWGIITNIADDSIEFISEGLPQATLDYLLANANTEQTKAQCASLLFCAIKENYPDSLDNVLNDIPMGIYAPLFSVLNAQQVSWGNFTDVLTSAKDSALGRNCAYIAIGYAMSSMYWFFQTIGVYAPTQKIMQQALATAEYFDSRECVDFPCMVWEHTLTFQEGIVDYEYFYGDGTLSNYTSGCQNATWIGPSWVRQNGEFRFQINGEAAFEITEVSVNVITSGSIYQFYVLNYYGGATLHADDEHIAGNQTRSTEIPEGHTGLWLWVASQNADGYNCPSPHTFQVTLHGTGTNPFE